MKQENRDKCFKKTREAEAIVMEKGSFIAVIQSMFCCNVGAPTIRT